MRNSELQEVRVECEVVGGERLTCLRRLSVSRGKETFSVGVRVFSRSGLLRDATSSGIAT